MLDEKFSILLPTDVKEKLKAEATAKGLPLVTYIRMILIEHLERISVKKE